MSKGNIKDQSERIFFTNIICILFLVFSSIELFGQDCFSINDSILIKNDSLIIIMSDTFSNYPFGQYSVGDSISTVLKRKDFHFYKRIINENHYRFFYKNEGSNFILFLEGEERFYEIVKAKILSNSFYKIFFRDKPILIGAEINTVIDVLVPNLDLPSRNEISTIHIKSALTGVEQYFSFKSGKLFEIKIDTDYTFSNEVDENYFK